MSGFSTSRSNISAIDNISKQYGPILRGFGPPVPRAGVLGDLYIDNFTFQLFEKRAVGTLDDWGHYLWVVPPVYRNGLKWFGASGPSNVLGRPGDFFLQWSGFDNYGMNLTVWGPKSLVGWPENGEGPQGDSGPHITNDNVDALGLLGEGAAQLDVSGSVLMALGLWDEYVIPLTVTANQTDPVSQIGVTNSGQLVVSLINPLYTAEDEHGI